MKHQLETNRRVLKLRWLNEEYPRYWDEGRNYHKKHKWRNNKKRKLILTYQVRMYRTWKYNRKTQYKLK